MSCACIVQWGCMCVCVNNRITPPPTTIIKILIKYILTFAIQTYTKSVTLYVCVVAYTVTHHLKTTLYRTIHVVYNKIFGRSIHAFHPSTDATPAPHSYYKNTQVRQAREIWYNLFNWIYICAKRWWLLLWVYCCIVLFPKGILIPYI